jgi:hypothetical protein
MLPDLGRLRANRPLRTPVFTVRYESCGIGVQGRNVEMDLDGWDRCHACPEFAACYALSLARFQVEHAVAEATGG